MIFVTVGTHEQQFNRLVKYMDELSNNGVIKDEIIIQTGFSTYEPKNCTWSSLLPYQEMVKNVNEARIVITHGGPSSFIMPLQIGKIPIVVPRQKKYSEHVNDHQMEFCKAVEERYGNILIIDHIEDLKKTILDYEKIVASMCVGIKSNNAVFNEQFEKIVEGLME